MYGLLLLLSVLYSTQGLKFVGQLGWTPPAIHPDVTEIRDAIQGGGLDSWTAGSYSVADKCYCLMSSAEMNPEIALYPIETDQGWTHLGGLCDAIGEGPGSTNRPLYNDFQCGHGPAGTDLDDLTCPGRPRQQNGCGQLGPKFDLTDINVTTNAEVAVPDGALPTSIAQFTTAVRVAGADPVEQSWASSFSVGNSCYCANFTSFEEGVGNYFTETPFGLMTIADVCTYVASNELILEDGDSQVFFNDIQCGNGPPGSSVNEHACPGRIDLGPDGCGFIGPKWNFEPYVPEIFFSPVPFTITRARFILTVSADNSTTTIDTDVEELTEEPTWTPIRIRSSIYAFQHTDTGLYLSTQEPGLLSETLGATEYFVISRDFRFTFYVRALLKLEVLRLRSSGEVDFTPDLDNPSARIDLREA